MKEALDRYISTYYSELRAYTSYFLSKMGLYIDADTVISNSYMYVLKINDNTTDQNKLKAYMLNTIKYQILWSTSKSHRDDRITAIEDNSPDRIDDDELNEKIRENNRHSYYKGLIEIYRKQITDKVELIVFEAYIDKGYITSRALATYFGISNTPAYYLIKELKQNISKLQYKYESESTY